MSISPVVAEFRDRARHEARRYGEDRWIFVRELLQNSRDALAARVEITVDSAGTLDRVTFSDDGRGMSFEEARKFLFTLYASSKSGDLGSAGKFGVGFWSVLRFEPTTIIVRSCPRHGTGWQARLSGSLEELELGEAEAIAGTQVVLERPCRGEDVLDEVRRAVYEDAGFVSSKEKSGEALEILVNGRRCQRDFALPPPSLSFERRGLRGVVALAKSPRVDLFAHGLRVRTAAELGDLALGDESMDRERDGAIAQSVSAHVLLDSSRLEVLLSRGDAREGPVLQRMVRLARKELDRLVRRELDRVAPASWWRRVAERLRSIRFQRWVTAATLIMVACLAFAFLATGTRGWLKEVVPGRWMSSAQPAPTEMGALSSAGGGPGAVPRGFGAGGPTYPGPIIDALGRDPAPVDLAYRPVNEQPLFALFRVNGLSADGELLPEAIGPSPTRLSEPCVQGCLDVELGLHADAGELLLPVPTGYAVEGGSVLLDGEPVELLPAPRDAVAIRLSRPSPGRLTYRVGPAPGMPRAAASSWPALPHDLQLFAAELRGKSLNEQVRESVRRVASLVAYDRSAAAVRQLRSARSQGTDYFAAVLGVGAGDCDVQCSLLAAVLDSAGATARMAIGYAGEGGRARPGLHAWVEVIDGAGATTAVEVPGGAAVAGEPPEMSGIPVHFIPEEGDVPTGRSLSMIAGAAIAVCLAGAAVIAAFARGRTRRRFVRGHGDSLQEMVKGALSGSSAFANIQSLHNRPLVPLVGAPAISLQGIRELACRGRLFSSRVRGALAETVASSGEVVVDGSHAVGAVVCELMGTRDLDQWQHLLEAGEATEVTRRVDEALARRGLGWRLRLVCGSADDLTALDLGCERVVAVEKDSDVCKAANRAAVRSVHQAAFILGDEVVRHLDLPGKSKTAVLADLARTAVLEAEISGRTSASEASRAP